MTANDALEFTPPIAAGTSNYTVNNLQQFYALRSLKLRPPFQRNLVWNPEQQSFLIDTILRGLPIPEVYLQTTVKANGEEEKVVVDGQQRITACLKFLNNRLRLVEHKELDPRWSGKTFAELDDSLQKRFRVFRLIGRELPELDPGVLREVFRRLNRTVESLEAQELRHAAYTGPFVTFIESAAAHPTFSELGIFSAKDYQRRRNDEFVAEVALASYAGAFPNKKDGLEELFIAFEKDSHASQTLGDLERRFGRVFDQLSEVGAPLRRSRFRNKSDFYSLMVYLLSHAERLPLTDETAEKFWKKVIEFGVRVNEIKREEGEAAVDPSVAHADDANAVAYLRAVERAASDRLNRVRRNRAIEATLDSIIQGEQLRPLNSNDAEWRNRIHENNDADDEIASADERNVMQAALVRAISDDELDNL